MVSEGFIPDPIEELENKIFKSLFIGIIKELYTCAKIAQTDVHGMHTYTAKFAYK